MVQTPEALRAKINSVEDLKSVVKTMKALASVHILQYEQAVESLADYTRTVEMGLQIVLRQRYFSQQESILARSTPVTGNRSGIVVFGSDQGLCGQFNEQIATYALEQLAQRQIHPENSILAVAGARVMPALELAGQTIAAQFALPTSIDGITAAGQEMLLTIEQWRSKQQIHQLLLLYNTPTSGASYQQQTVQLFPLDPDWLRDLERRSWASTTLPTFTMDWDALFSALIQQYLFVLLYRAFAESLAGENASRLASMQAAEKNIEERLSDLNADYRRQRQSSITAELLDIVSGFEALNTGCS